MVDFLKRLFRRDDPAKTDAQRIYRAIMEQARQPDFYGNGKAIDNYDGRIDILTLHLSTILHALNGFDEQGKRLSQAIYEVMREDFDIALREEGLSDTGVMKRIKPMISLFYTRIKSYTDAFEADNSQNQLMLSLQAGLLKELNGSAFAEKLSLYIIKLRQNMDNKSLGQLALVDFDFPVLKF